jgi:hypothetical protein
MAATDYWVSAMCGTLPPTIRFSASEKADSRSYYIWMVYLQIFRTHAQIAFDRLLLRLNRDN